MLQKKPNIDSLMKMAKETLPRIASVASQIVFIAYAFAISQSILSALAIYLMAYFAQDFIIIRAVHDKFPSLDQTRLEEMLAEVIAAKKKLLPWTTIAWLALPILYELSRSMTA